MTMHTTYVSARSAHLHAATDGDDDGPPYRFHGIAVAAGDILHMDDGTPVLFTEDELRKAAASQAGEPLTKDHPRDADGTPMYPPPTDETIGTVPAAEYLDSEDGVAYDASTHDEDIARGVQGGTYDVSVHPTFSLGDKDPETGAYIAKDVEFRDLSVVSKGDSPSNTANWGPSQQLAAWAHGGAGGTAGADDAPDDAGAQASAQGFLARLRQLAADDRTRSPAQPDDEPAEPGADADEDDDTDNMGDQDPDDPTDPDGSNGDGGGTGDGPTTLADMTPDELGEVLREQGFVTEDSLGDVVDQATAQKQKREQVDEIIAQSDDYDEDDAEELMASADSLVEREHKRITGQSAASLPGAAGGRSYAQADASSDEDDLDAYGTGVGN